MRNVNFGIYYLLIEYNVEELLKYEVIDIIHNLCHKGDDEKVHLASVKLLHQLTEFTSGREHILNYAQRNRYGIHGTII